MTDSTLNIANTASNIIYFPKDRLASPPQNQEEVSENLEYFRISHIQDSLEMIIPMLFNQISMAGFNSLSHEDEDTEKLGALIVESIKAYMCKNHSIEHSFEKLASKLFVYGEDGDINLDDSLTIRLIVKNKEVLPSTDKPTDQE